MDNNPALQKEAMPEPKKWGPAVFCGIFGLSALIALPQVTMVASQAVAASFPGVPEALVSMVFTLPTIISIVTALLCGVLSMRVSKKLLAIIGVFMFTVGGVLCAVNVNNIIYLLICRAILGLGLGLFQPLSTSIVADFYGARKDFNRFMGYQTVFQSLGGIIFSTLMGVLVAIDWRTAMLLHLAAGIVLLLLFALPNKKNYPVFDMKPPAGMEPPAGGAGEAVEFAAEGEIARMEGKPAGKAKLPATVILLYILQILYMMCFMAFNQTLAFIVIGSGLGDASLVGLLSAVMTLGGAVVSFFFGAISKVFKQYCFFVASVLLIIGFALVYFGGSIPLLVIGVLLVGCGQCIFIPTFFTELSIQSGPLVTLTHSWAVVALGVANLAMSVVLVPICQAIFGSGLSPQLLLTALVVMIPVAIFACIVAFICNKRNKNFSTMG